MSIIKLIKRVFTRNNNPPCPVYYVDFKAKKLLSKVGNDVSRDVETKAA